MQIFVATSLDLINWLIGLFGSAEKKVHISDHSNKIDDAYWFKVYILLIVIGFVFFHLYRLGENKQLNSNTNEIEEEEPEHLVDESDRDFVPDWQLSPETSEHDGAAGRQIPCAFCGDISTTRCARCKVARYCSAECQIGHWRSWHRYECVEIETEENQERDVNGHKTPMLVEEKKYDNESFPNESLNSNVVVDGSSSSDVYNSHIGCVECGNPSTTRCSLCKSVRYCSTKCLITNWRWHKYNCIAGDVSSAPTEIPDRNVGVLKHSNKEDESIHSSSPLYLELHPGTSNFKSPAEVSQVTTKESHVHKTQWVKYLEDELVKSRKEIFAIQSECDDWKRRANFAREMFQSFKQISENQLSVLRNENESISNAEKKACNVTHSLNERLKLLQVAAQENFAEKRRLEEHIQMVENECAKLKKELQEEHKHVQYLTLESNKSHETAQIAIREVEAVRQELLEEREHVQRVKENFIRDVTFSESRAISAEAKLSDIRRKIKLTRKACTICLTNEKDMAFGCGHMTCRDCGSKLSKCPICREQITSHIKLFPG